MQLARDGMLWLGVVGISAAFGFVTMADAETASEPSPQLIRNSDNDGADRPSGRLVLRVPAANTGNEGPDVEAGSPPVEPSGPTIEEEDAPTYFGEPITGTFLWILDCSESMETSDGGSTMENWGGNVVSNPTRLEIVKTETIRALKSLTERNQFDIIQLAGNTNPDGLRFTPPLTDEWQGELVPATDENREEAIRFVQDMGVWWGTPTYTVLQKACSNYGADIGTLFLLSDGAPTWCDIPTLGPDQNMWQSEDAQRAILGEFPVWFAPLRTSGCNFKCIHIGNHFAAGSFLQELAAQNDGSYLHVE